MPVYFKCMALSVKAVTKAYLLLKIFEFFRIKFDDAAASIANHMVVMSMAEGMLIYVAFFGPGHFFYESALKQEVQGPVD